MVVLMVIGPPSIDDADTRERVTAVLDALQYERAISKLLSGGASGIDDIAKDWATLHNIPVQECLPDQKQYGRSGGIVRNAQMISMSTSVVAFWDGRSKEIRRVIDTASRQNKLSKIVLVASSKRRI